MATAIKLTKAQKDVMRAIHDGMIINKRGTGYEMRDASGHWIGKASIAVKSLGLMGLVAKADDRIYFTTRGQWVWVGGSAKGEAARLCALADERLAWVKNMTMQHDADDYKAVVNWWAL